jgi:pimeloyl-ACP methyl ester carboxylesterase
MEKILRLTVAITLALVSIVCAAGLVFWVGGAYSATDTALQAIQSDPAVFVTEENAWVIFFPSGDPRPETGFIFYPGANVDFRAYAPVMKLIAAEGYFVTVLPMPLNLSFFDSNGAARAQAAYPEIENWFVGGHSLGGVTASSYVSTHEEIQGLALWASAPGNDALIGRESNVLLIYGTRDGLFTPSMAENAREFLPLETTYVPIEGGNHSQFGAYGFQEGDLEAAVSPEEQWAQVAAATVEFMEGVLK